MDRFDPDIELGSVLDNGDIQRIFKCGARGGMRRSKKTNSLVLISDPTKGIYKDRWENGTLHYTGMGYRGNQNIGFSQNRTLAESENNGVNLFLFEVFEKKKYYYHGRAKLAEAPYQARQVDLDGDVRDVWIFPLTLVDNVNQGGVPGYLVELKEDSDKKRVAKLSDDELKRGMQAVVQGGSNRRVVSNRYERSPYVSEYAKRRANGVCQLCGSVAPFEDKGGEPFLETHHIRWLAEGGEDTIQNTVALCPNCHRKMHVLNLRRDRRYLLEQASHMV